MWNLTPCKKKKKTRELLTIDVETVLVQDVGAQLGDAIGQLAQLPVQPLPVQPWTHGVRTVVADDIHSGGCPVPLGPGEGGGGDDNK